MKRFIKISLTSSLICYLVIAFVRWDLYTWIVNIPNYELGSRAAIALFYAFKIFIDFAITNITKPKQ